MNESIVSIKSFAFTLAAIKFYIYAKKRHEFVLADQFLRSSSSIGANIREASAAVSRRDFVYKMSIASKEARETLYWIEIFQKSDDLQLNCPELEPLHRRCLELCRMLTSIVKSTTIP